MKVLITGITGFVGKSIGLELSKRYDIVGIGRKNMPFDYKVDYHKVDISDENEIMHFSNLNEFDAIVHCAACLLTNNFNKGHLDVNIRGLRNVIEIGIKHHCKKFIYISSIPVIGIPTNFPITEEHPVYPLSTYHLTKYFGELLVDAYSELHAISLRIPSPVGVGMPNKILSVFIQKCKKNEPIELLGKGGRCQNYVDVRDIARAVSLAISSNETGVFNIASSKFISNYDLASLCKRLLHSSSELFFKGEDPSEDICWDISIEKARKILQFEPKVPIEQTILDIAKSYESFSL